MGEQFLMLRQLIGQLQETMHHDGSPWPNHPPFSLKVEDYRRWCIPCLEENSADYCHNLTTSDKSSEKFKMAETLSPPAKRFKKDQNCGNSSAEETSKDEMMDPKIWQDFPEDLFETVVARLPITTFFRFRTVCRLWNSMVESESFSQHCFLRNPKSMPWFYITTNLYSGAVYDHSSNKWYYPIKSSMMPWETVIPVASAGGLVCFSGICRKKYCVLNPFNQSFRELPAGSLKIRYSGYVVVGMILNGKSTREGYKVMLVKRTGEYQVYDSLKNSWTRPGSVPLSIDLPVSMNCRSQPVSVGTEFYFLLSNPEGIMSYDVVSDTWKHLIIPASLQTGDLMLTECNGRIILIGLLTKNAASCVSVWELQKMTLLWKEVDRMPNLMCLEFYGKNLRMSCMGNKSCLVMLSLRTMDMNQLVMYNVATKEWGPVIGSMAVQPGTYEWIESGTAFHPSPTAMA